MKKSVDHINKKEKYNIDFLSRLNNNTHVGRRSSCILRIVIRGGSSVLIKVKNSIIFTLPCGFFINFKFSLCDATPRIGVISVIQSSLNYTQVTRIDVTPRRFNIVHKN